MAFSARTFSARQYPVPVPRDFPIWFFGCPHTPADKANGRNSISQSIFEVERFRPKYAFSGGDYWSNQGSAELTNPADVLSGQDIAAQLGSGTILTREMIDEGIGNHDAGVNNYDVYRRYVDPMGENTAYSGVNNALRPYPRTGDWRRRATLIGNVLFLIIPDANGDGCSPCGFPAAPTGGYPSGSWLEADYLWFEAQVLANTGKTIIVITHHLLKNTTIATGDFEGVNGGFHGSTGQPIASGNLYNIIVDSTTFEADQSRIQTFLNANPGAVSAWIAEHTHYNVGETYAGRTWYFVDANGMYNINPGGLTRFHVVKQPQSGVGFFREGSATMKFIKMHHGGYYRYPGLDSAYVLNVPLRYPFVHP
jgi:hypothetical protein